MAAEDPEARLRARIIHAVTNVGEPDDGRLAAIEARLPQSTALQRYFAPWLAAALLTASAAGTAAWWTTVNDSAGREDGPPVEAPEMAPNEHEPRSATAPAHDPEREESTEQSQDQAPQGDHPVIYRR